MRGGDGKAGNNEINSFEQKSEPITQLVYSPSPIRKSSQLHNTLHSDLLSVVGLLAALLPIKLRVQSE